MAKSCDSIVLCRGLPEQTLQEDNYLITLQSVGYKCYYLYTSRFEFDNSPNLKMCLQNAEYYSGLILTSQRAVEAIYNILKDDKISLSRWQKLPAYCVGPATASLAKNNLGLEFCLGSETGNTKDLAKVIISHKALITKPLLYPCSEIAHATIEQVLSKNSIDLKKLVAYRTVMRQSLEADFLNIVSTTPKIYVFFSPSTVDYFVSILKRHPNYIKNIKAVAIGPTTKQSLIQAKFEVYATAANPNPTSLLEAINNAGCNSNSDTMM
ncbi:PREDICTED: uroporphyrinogen-III synthase-like [Polistes dominula]|uniref:Uroporphyrinogen-III synthase-like n=1 Tax=Polistes dominula TaxID=743375 RepID=A0ABM1IID6_POLDO|nr:PREDICTED: uroporphyrinogen-III synthase-like [Polistes dominula]